MQKLTQKALPVYDIDPDEAPPASQPHGVARGYSINLLNLYKSTKADAEGAARSASGQAATKRQRVCVGVGEGVGGGVGACASMGHVAAREVRTESCRRCRIYIYIMCVCMYIHVYNICMYVCSMYGNHWLK